ncbi:hypothetical protein [Agrococcus jejuensis]|nr:hypothetical protein [Agrococcus jejuensis]
MQRCLTSALPHTQDDEVERAPTMMTPHTRRTSTATTNATGAAL